jgi:hypothetical protein
MMFITKQDAAQLIDLAIRYTCVKLRVSEFGIIEHDELLAGIAAKDAETHRLLRDFLTSYSAWFEFHESIDRQGKQGRLSETETRHLMELSNRKDATRAQIVKQLKSMPST